MPSRPFVGAIRWDAWYTPGSLPTDAVQRSLSPEQYRWRLPFFAHQSADGSVTFWPISQGLIDREIEQATYAGLDFWAFVAYSGEDPMSTALKYYISSTKRAHIKFCLFCELVRWGSVSESSALIAEHLSIMSTDSYVRLPGGRPLYFLGFISERLVSQRWGSMDALRSQIDRFRRSAEAVGVGNPYLVVSGSRWDSIEWAAELGADAVTAYAIADFKGSGSYEALAQYSEEGWSTLSAAGLPVVPTVMTGWDRRPRISHPVPWEQWQEVNVGLQHYYDSPSQNGLSDHLSHALQWARSRDGGCSPIVLVYAWNENDEGGWLIPTLSCNEDRLQAVRNVLNPIGHTRDSGCVGGR
jgi:hypothetical protein